MALLHRLLRQTLLSTRSSSPSLLLPLSSISFSSSPHPPDPNDPLIDSPVQSSQPPLPPANSNPTVFENTLPPPKAAIPIVSYPVFQQEDRRRPRVPGRQDAYSYPASEEQQASETSAGLSYSSDIIPPVYEQAYRPRVAPLPEDRRPENISGEVSPGQSWQPDGQQDWVPQGQSWLSRDVQSEAAATVFGSGMQEAHWNRQAEVKEFIPEDQWVIPVPAFVKVETKRRPDPVVLLDAIRAVKANRKARFDETVEAAVRLGVDTKRSDQLVRGAATLPHGTGKVVRVAVFAEGDEAEEARSAGADVVGADDLVDIILQSGGKLDFDKCVATPAIMPKLSKVARILGPRGLMPNPKVGTVTKNVGNAVKHLKQGRVDFRADKTGIVHAGIGKVSFTEEALRDNVAAFANAVLAAKPPGLKKTSKYAGYMLTFTICSTMGPGVRVAIQSISQAVDSYTKAMELQ